MNSKTIAAAAIVTLALALPAQAQTQGGTSAQAPSQTTAPPATAPKPVVAPKKKPHLLTPDEIKATFGTGKAFAAKSLSGKVIMFTLKPDGSATAVPKGSKSGRKGTWRVSDTGYCSTWEKGAEHCYQIRQLGAGYDVETNTGTVVAHWVKP
jgi:hypothetical protein